MEKKNTVLLTIVAIATLLVAIVGATFAYFTATTTNSGNTGTGVADVNTATVSGARLELESSDTVSYLSYPGGFAYTSAMFNAVKIDGVKDPNEYEITYKVDMEFNNGTSMTPVTWKLYRADTPTKFENAKTCTLTTVAINTETRFYYTCEGDNGTYGGTLVDSGTIAAGQSEAFSAKDAQKLKTNDTAIYYYLEIEYPNRDYSQDLDKDKNISAAITGVSDISSVATK